VIVNQQQAYHVHRSRFRFFHSVRQPRTYGVQERRHRLGSKTKLH
jgi:hypothetical protein